MIKYNWINLRKEIDNIEKLSDIVEKDTRFQLVDIIIEKINEYNEHVSNYEYNEKRKEIINRGVVFVPLPRPSTIKANWSKLFAASVSSVDKKQIGYESYRWHIFSFEKVDAHTNAKARQAFNRCKKEKVYSFFQHKDEAFYIDNAHLLRSTDFDLDQDIYIFDISNKWTYVHTHESQCGPYFHQLKLTLN
jgi:hypothetical protein